MELCKNGIPVYEFVPSYGGRKLIVSIDSSKSNSAMIVWDEYGHPLDDYEISGAGSDVDVYELCWDTRKELRKLFYGAEVVLCGIEDIITKKESKVRYGKDGKTTYEYHGLDTHQSRAKITAVFDNFIFFFQDYCNINPIKVPNWAWKHGVLPEEYRTKGHRKGSLDWLNDIGSRFAGRKDDVTDAFCIGLYIINNNKIDTAYELDSTQPANYKYDFLLYPATYQRPAGSKLFVIKNTDTFEHNLDTISNRIEDGQIGCAKIPLEIIPLEVIYSDKLRTTSDYKYERHETEVMVIVAHTK